MKKVIKIGAIYPLSGSLSPIGEDIQKAMLLAKDIANHPSKLPTNIKDALGRFASQKYKIQLVFGDSQGDPAIGVQEAKRLIDEQGVSALIGAYQSSVTDATSLLSETKDIPYVNPESSAPTLTQRGLQWFFRTGADDVLYTELMFELIRFLEFQGQQLARFGILSESSEFGLEASAVEIAAIGEFGGNVTAFEIYSPTSSLEEAIERIRRQNPQVVLGQQFLSDAITVVNTLKALDWFPDGLVVQNAGYVVPEFLESLGKDGNYIISRASWALGLGREKPLVTEINRLFKKRYGENMNETNARSFTGLMVLIDAINRAGSKSPFKIRKALRRTNIPGSELIMPWKGVRFNDEGQNILADGLLVQILKQKYRIIWPLDLKEKTVVWPAPSWEDRKKT
ncbi:ABC transporter substrate-binding protein [Halobacillus sp. Marseille-Q1614]|uniref:ABC transporter substrate-binding protein n=1 Tax=Halobacillus sp. Marseille-Q1614 TaxID=2709134 RepID=UPI0015708D3A|nr:ABC transporter substrate-binding protein [Halobacillus sp. Marseille-Q1614]